MKTLSLLVLIFLSMFAYSAGAVSVGKKYEEPKPRLADLFFMLLIWAAAIFSRTALDWNKWLLTCGWVVLAYLTGRLTSLFRKLPVRRAGPASDKPAEPAHRVNKFRPTWKAFSKRSGNFQSRLVLSYFFFLCVTPFGLGVKIFRDPLRLRQGEKTSYWLPKKDTADDVEQSRRQF